MKSILSLSTITLLFCLLFPLSTEANTNVMHGAYAVDFFIRLTRDPSYHDYLPEKDREALSFKTDENGKIILSLSDAQKAFLVGSNLPDAFPLMILTHNKMPTAMINAISDLSGTLPATYRNESDKNKQFILDMQKYMAWGAKTHVLGDMEIHPILAEYSMPVHLYVEPIRDAKMHELLLKDKLYDEFSEKEKKTLTDFAKKYGPFDSPNLGDWFGFDIRDNFINMILDYVSGDKDKGGKHIGMSMDMLVSYLGDFVQSQELLAYHLWILEMQYANPISNFVDTVIMALKLAYPEHMKDFNLNAFRREATRIRIRYPDYDSLEDDMKLHEISNGGSEESKKVVDAISRLVFTLRLENVPDLDTGKEPDIDRDMEDRLKDTLGDLDTEGQPGQDTGGLFSGSDSESNGDGDKTDDNPGSGNTGTNDADGNTENGNTGTDGQGGDASSQRPSRRGLFNVENYNVGGTSSDKKE